MNIPEIIIVTNTYLVLESSVLRARYVDDVYAIWKKLRASPFMII